MTHYSKYCLSADTNHPTERKALVTFCERLRNQAMSTAVIL
jgi:hypothetical protein